MTMTTTPTSELTAKPFLSADVLRRECESLMKEKAELLAQNAAMRKALEGIEKVASFAYRGGMSNTLISYGEISRAARAALASPPVDVLTLLDAEDRATILAACDAGQEEIMRGDGVDDLYDRYAAMRKRLDAAKGGAE